MVDKQTRKTIFDTNHHPYLFKKNTLVSSKLSSLEHLQIVSRTLEAGPIPDSNIYLHLSNVQSHIINSWANILLTETLQECSLCDHETPHTSFPSSCVTPCHKGNKLGWIMQEGSMSWFRFTPFLPMFVRKMMIAWTLHAYAGTLDINPKWLLLLYWSFFLRSGICTCRPGYVEWKWECHPMSGLGESCITTAQCVSQVVSIVSKCIKFVINHCENCTGKWSQPCV